MADSDPPAAELDPDEQPSAEEDIPGPHDLWKLYEQRYSEASDAYDKVILTLSGGALAISFTFVKDLIGDKPTEWVACLWLAWVAFGLSLTSILIGLLAVQSSLQRAMNHTLDEREAGEPGGPFAAWTRWLNVAAALLFLAGVVLLILFSSRNLP